MRSNELIALKSLTTGEVTKILPYTEFQSLPSGEYINLNEARIMVNGKTHQVLRAGEIIRNSVNIGKKPQEVKEAKPKARVIDTIQASVDNLLDISND